MFVCGREAIPRLGGEQPGGIDPAGDTVLENQSGALFRARSMRVNIDQTGHHEFAARVHHFGTAGVDIGGDGRNTPIRDRHIANRIQPA